MTGFDDLEAAARRGLRAAQVVGTIAADALNKITEVRKDPNLWTDHPVDEPEVAEPSAIYTGTTRPLSGRVSEVMVTVWSDGVAEIAFRQGFESWGPPTTLTRVPEKMKEQNNG